MKNTNTPFASSPSSLRHPFPNFPFPHSRCFSHWVPLQTTVMQRAWRRSTTLPSWGTTQEHVRPSSGTTLRWALQTSNINYLIWFQSLIHCPEAQFESLIFNRWSFCKLDSQVIPSRKLAVLYTGLSHWNWNVNLRALRIELDNWTSSWASNQASGLQIELDNWTSNRASGLWIKLQTCESSSGGYEPNLWRFWAVYHRWMWLGSFFTVGEWYCNGLSDKTWRTR